MVTSRILYLDRGKKSLPMLFAKIPRLAIKVGGKRIPIISRHFCLSITSASTWTHFLSETLSLEQVKQAHALAVLHGALQSSVRICAVLMRNYAAFEDFVTPRVLFEQSCLKSEGAFLWNTLIRVYSIAGSQYDAFDIYNGLLRAGVRPDDHTFPFVLTVCADDSASQKGEEIHALIFKLGFDRDVFVANTLLAFYASVKNLSDTQRVFNEMHERDIVSWNSIISAFSDNGYYPEALCWFFELKLTSGLKPNSVSVVSVLPVCAGLEDEIMASTTHGYVVKSGMDSQVTICNALVDVYGKCGISSASKRVFDGMIGRNVVSWNAIISTFTHNKLHKDALYMFRLMVAADVKPNSITLSSMLPVLVELEFFNMGKEIHGYGIRIGLESDIFVANSLIDMYAKSGHSMKASNVFCKMNVWNVVTWNTMVAGFAQNRLELDALNLIKQMQMHGECPNSVTFTNALPACGRIGLLRQGKEIHARSIRTGFIFDLFVSNALTDMYAKCRCLNLARSVFNISHRDEISYNILIEGYSLSQHCSESLKLFSEMGLIGLKHDTVSFVGVLKACANISAIKQGKEIHGLLIRKLFHSHLFVANSLLDLYTKCGRVDLARLVFDRIPCKDAASWNTMILGYGMQGQLGVAIELFDAMKENGVDYDSVSYIAVLSVCSHGGMVEKGQRYFEQMCSQDIEPTQMHYACMVDLLGRAGLMKEAEELIKGLPIVPDANVWGALLGACRATGNIELGAWAAEHLFELKPENCGYYILLSNMYAEAGKWDEAKKVRELMRSRGVKKNPGCSWVEIHNQFHAFVVGESLERPELGHWIA
ncbi:PREDICTED: pentatricopeptide repeat-containing protein At4g14170-like [Nelumbo nucifera]|uniref:Pentatricopeptide repeat-containing protein At4g14170-like n=2 Tax=Nelumbo nucifera TaxID=4432 RepID=A0A822XP96_NELNU|nr:PREDICTED: pentatricopeptide repeat-containing protein At4g14170-like [Nelumbo nucifera]DAD22127.1 TPA_asm: hypothetical protein HUJ06_023590 [Nelumbo nucifera]